MDHFLKSLLNLLQYCFCFMFWFFWLWGMWDLTSLTRYWTHTLCIRSRNLNHWTAREVPCALLEMVVYSRKETKMSRTGEERERHSGRRWKLCKWSTGRACKSLSDLPLQFHSPSIPFCFKMHKSSTSIYGFFLAPVTLFYITASFWLKHTSCSLLAFLFLL